MDKNIKELFKKMNKEVKPGRVYALKMKLRLRSKAYAMGWKQATYGMGAWKTAGVFSMIIIVLTGGIGTYAYASPEVTVDHPLYPFKQGIESAEEFFAYDAANQTAVQMKHARKRIEEMEALADRIEKSGRPEKDEEDVKRTMKMMEGHMKNCMMSAAREDKVQNAERMIQEMHENFADFEKHLDMMDERQHLKAVSSIHANLGDMRDFTRNKLKRIEEVRNEIESPVRIQKARIIMRRLTDDDSDILENDERSPVLQFTFSR